MLLIYALLSLLRTLEHTEAFPAHRGYTGIKSLNCSTSTPLLFSSSPWFLAPAYLHLFSALTCLFCLCSFKPTPYLVLPPHPNLRSLAAARVELDVKRSMHKFSSSTPTLSLCPYPSSTSQYNKWMALPANRGYKCIACFTKVC